MRSAAKETFSLTHSLIDQLLTLNTFPAQVATKVVVQNARLPIAPVEQVHHRMVASLQAFPYSHFVQG